MLIFHGMKFCNSIGKSVESEFAIFPMEVIVQKNVGYRGSVILSSSGDQYEWTYVSCIE
jgi:hypothetical protein